MERRRQEETQEEERVDVSVCSLVPRHKHRCDNFPASPLILMQYFFVTEDLEDGRCFLFVPTHLKTAFGEDKKHDGCS